MAVMESVIVIGHNPLAEGIAAGLAGAGHPVTQVVPSPDAVPFSLPMACPIPELAALAVRADLPLQPPERLLTEPRTLTRTPHGYELLLADGSTISANHLVLASSRWAVPLLKPLELNLPLRPARAHQLTIANTTPGQLAFPKTQAEHLGYGTVVAWPTPEETVLVYDGLADPAQATFKPQPDPRVVTALRQWLVPFTGAADTLAEPVVTAWQLATTPDYLPILGPWPGIPGLWLACGCAGWAAGLAPAVASLFVTTFRGQSWPAGLAFVGPGRVRDGDAGPTLRPLWLVERQPISQLPQFAATVRMVGGKIFDPRGDRTVNLIGAGDASLADMVRFSEKSTVKASGSGFREKSKPRGAPVK